MRTLATRCSAAIAALGLGLAASAQELSDLWFSPAESGWGLQLVQQGDTAFATLFLYDAEGRPMWLVAPEERTVALTSSGLPVMAGTLYRTRGPFHGGTFDPAQVVATPVGTLDIEPLSPESLRVSYTADGIAVTKSVTRQTFRAPELDGFYLGAFNLLHSRPGGPAFGRRRFDADVTLQVDGDIATMRTEEAGLDTCEYRGARTASGKLASISGTFQCASGERGSFEIRELERTRHGLTGFLTRTSPTEQASGRFSATR